MGVRIPANRLAKLRQMRDSGTIKSDDLLSTLVREFPGQFAGWTLDAIREACGKKG
jgi:hypothetical protein